MKKNTRYVKNGYEAIMFPMETCNITQGDNVGSHLGTYAVDLTGKDTRRDYAYFPFSAVSKALDVPQNGNAVCWESLNKVLFADGTIDYCTMLVVHDNDPTGTSPGNKYSQGQQMAQEGTAGKATGNHLHIEVAKGKFTKMYTRNAQGTAHLPNNIPIEKACFMDDTVIIKGVANWKYLKDIVDNKIDQILEKGSRVNFPTRVEVVQVYADNTCDVIIGGKIIKGIPTGPLTEVK